ncbi:hypothetical protein DIS24_g2460 [Lasiodiplodia hormozganensis]|uniref:Uncharacterized protein n=2 Tax=Lasiodiplodia TaxID=66739 RepID=A0A5N5DN48_9PEZI|nr:uncharacterized protein LTHEOB_1568 [Lasiodiplodia theobromae]KAB2579243.1 hypothetical protein DBV05_g2139 [Lasiodiplodia theobromae]KAF4537377.1 hypothetical protein LTHEOB_1568 [Lasiodiplodia theobromae]KAK0661836.1 hypothetical protein DIS24_g2460 [Lasiodiplodia hormozganensis]
MPPPSIILTPATSSTSEQARNVSLHIAPARRPSTENITNQYRNRYALYLAAQFNISAAAAFVEIDEQIRFNQSRKSAAVSEADIRNVRTGDSF